MAANSSSDRGVLPIIGRGASSVQGSKSSAKGGSGVQIFNGWAANGRRELQVLIYSRTSQSSSWCTGCPCRGPLESHTFESSMWSRGPWPGRGVVREPSPHMLGRDPDPRWITHSAREDFLGAHSRIPSPPANCPLGVDGGPDRCSQSALG
jgi:hypothetical protein